VIRELRAEGREQVREQDREPAKERDRERQRDDSTCDRIMRSVRVQRLLQRTC